MRPAVRVLVCGLALSAAAPRPEASTPPLPLVEVEAQPLAAQAARVADALALLGSPLPPADRAALTAAADRPDASAAIQAVLDRHCLLDIHINPESRVKVAAGPARADLVEHGWRTFLVKVRNEAGVTARLRLTSPSAERVFSRGPRGSSMDPRPAQTITGRDVADRWLDLEVFDKPPLAPTLSGLPVEYRIVQLYSRDAGRREATLAADVGQGSQDLGFRSEAPILFTAAPSVDVTLRVRDEKGRPTVAAFVIRDAPGPHLSVAGQAPGARLRLPPAGLPRRRRDGAARSRCLRRRGEPRTGVRPAEAAPDRGARAGHAHRDARALDRPARARLVLWRPSHPRRRLPALRDADDRRRAAGHDAAHPGRGPERRLGADVGPGLLPPEAVLRGARPRALDQGLADALRRRGLGLPVEPRRAPRAAAPEGPGLPGREGARGLADVDAADPAVGQGAGRGRRLRALRLGPARSRTLPSRHPSCRRSTASAPTSTSSTWRTTRSTSSPRSTRRRRGS